MKILIPLVLILSIGVLVLIVVFDRLWNWIVCEVALGVVVVVVVLGSGRVGKWDRELMKVLSDIGFRFESFLKRWH